MNKFLIGSFLILTMAACGSGGHFVGDPHTIQNRTQGIASDANLQYQWVIAINMVANGTPLDPAHSLNWVSDPRALNETPNGVIVTCQNDIPFSELARLTGNPAWVTNHPDDSIESNIILLNGLAVHGYAIVADNKVVTACSGVAQIMDAPTGVGNPTYEFENIVLYRLGYDVSKR